ncbi:MAG: hypothetical protein LE169_04675 [Endomicrobium sp.]|nr:hypothetical protein [Endomicrobium sp.]
MPVPTPPTPTPTVRSNLDLDPVKELCGNKKNVISYVLHSVLSYAVNSMLTTPHFSVNCSVGGLNLSKFFRMVSVFSFPVHAALTNLSFLSKPKISLAFLAVDTLLSLYRLITKNTSINDIFDKTQSVLEAVRFVAYPHILAIFSFDFHVIKGIMWE